jgi:hypothetical protein
MPRQKSKEKEQLGTYIPWKLAERLRAFSEESGLPITRLVQEGLEIRLSQPVRVSARRVRQKRARDV